MVAYVCWTRNGLRSISFSLSTSQGEIGCEGCARDRVGLPGGRAVVSAVTVAQYRAALAHPRNIGSGAQRTTLGLVMCSY